MTPAERTAYNTKLHAERTDAAAALLAAGFASEAKRKAALDTLSAGWRALRDNISAALLADRDTEAGMSQALTDLYYALPFDLHHWRSKHSADHPAWAEQVEALVDLRAAIKAAPVEPKPAREDHPLLVIARVVPDALDWESLRDRRVRQYADALDLGRRLGGLPVNVHRVWCVNYAGTEWVRLDWYLKGRRVQFSVVAAAYDRLVREGVIIEKA